MSSNLADLPLDLLADLLPQHLVVKMSSNLADLPLDLLADLLPQKTTPSAMQDGISNYGRSTPSSGCQIYPLDTSRHLGGEFLLSSEYLGQ